ncbi:hypothetical protein ABW19_dt0209320 [Dactylella cylindrospora]|nr:hypothetical protein ABW19_dt0209320 [Dactylella cylindrospora]
MATTSDHRPPYPTAETVIDSDDDADIVDERITVGNHKPSKGGVDTWVNKPSQKKSKGEDKKAGRSASVKEKSKRWSFGMPPLVIREERRPQHKARTMSMSDVRRNSASEKTTHLPPKLPLDSITTHTFSSAKGSIAVAATKNSSTHSLPTPAASPSSDTHPGNSNGNNSSSTSSSASSSSSKDSGISTSASVKISSASSAASAAAAPPPLLPSGKIISSTSGISPLGTSPNRPRSYSAYPTTSSSSSSSFPPVSISSAALASGIKKPPTPISPIEESPNLNMPALKKAQKANQPVPLAPSSVVSAGSDSSSPSVSSGSTGSSLENPPDNRRANFRNLAHLQTQNNAYFASVSDEVQSPMPEAPAPPSRGSTATSDEDSNSGDVKQPAEQKNGTQFPSSSTAPTPKATIPPTKIGNTRPPVHGRTYSNATVTGPEYEQDSYAYQYPLNRKRNSFSSNGSRTTAVPTGVSPGAAAGLGFDQSVFEYQYLDEGEEDAAAAVAASHGAPHDVPDSMSPEQEPAQPAEPAQKSPVKPTSPKKATPTSAAPPKSAPSHAQDYFNQRPYSGYGAYPMHYDSYMSPEGAKADPVAQSAKPMNETFKNLSNEGEHAMVHTPQKSGFKESIQARRAAAAAAEAQAVEASEIEEYHDEGYDNYSTYVPPSGPPPYRGGGGRRMTATQPPPPPPVHDMYTGYPPHPHPPPPQRSYTDSYQPYGRPPMPPHNNTMYGQQPQYMRGMPPAPGGYGKSFAGSQVSGYGSPHFGSMINSANSELATTVLGGRYSQHATGRHPMAPSNLSTLSYAQPGYNDYYGYDGYYEDPNAYHHEEPEYEEPQSIPSASPQYTKRRPMSGDFGPAKRPAMHGQWTAEWADTDSNRGSTRGPADKIDETPEREEFELGKDGNDDQSWAKPAKTRRRNTITKQTHFSSGFSDASSAKLTSAASSRMQALSEADIKSEASDPRQPPSINTSLPKQKHGLPTPEDSPPAIKQCRAPPRPPSTHSNATSFALKNATLATIPTALGYPHLSNHLAASPNTAIYRRFDNLNHRILLHLQDEICELESLLENLDNAEQHSGNGGAGLRTRRGLNSAGQRAPGPLDDRSARRLELMGAIFVKLQQYNNALAAYSKILSDLPGATHENLSQYREWMSVHQPIVPEEMDFVFRADDFSTLITDPAAPKMNVHIPSPRASRSPSFSGRAPSPVEGILEGLITWIKNQETPVQLGVLASVFFLLPLFLFLSTSTYAGIMILVTFLTAGFCYCSAQILFNEELTKQASKPAIDVLRPNEPNPTNATASEVKA